MHYSTKIGNNYAFEIEVFTITGMNGSLPIVDLSWWFSWKGDHSPQIHFHFIFLGLKIIDTGIHNIHHEECEESCNEYR